MNIALTSIINQIKAERKEYSDFKTLISKIKESKEKEVISKDDILDLVVSDYRIQLHATPNSIAKLIAHLASKKQAKNAIDICCGTGNILYYLQNTIDDLTGIEISDNIALLTSYFIPDLKIITADTFKYPFTKKYDLVVGNIPWGLRVDYNGKRIPGEEAFIRKAIELCNENGEAIILVPYTILVSTKFQQLRSDLHNQLQEIISLPSGVIRNTKIKTALLVFNKDNTDAVSISILSQFDNLIEEYSTTKKIVIPKDNLLDRWDSEFYTVKKHSFYEDLEGLNTVELQNLAEILNGRNIPSDKLKTEGQLLYLKPIHINDGKLVADKSLKYLDKSDLREIDYKCIIQPGDIIISTIFNDLKMYVYSKNDISAYASNNLAIIRSSEQDYILSYLQTEEGKRIFRYQAEVLRRGVTIPHLSLKDLQGIRIPVLPISELNTLGNKSIEKSSKNELQDYLDLLQSFKRDSPGMVKEPTLNYNGHVVDQAELIFSFINDRFNRIESQLKIVNKKLDKLLVTIKELKVDFDEVKLLNRDDEEKLFKLYQKIDAKLDSIYANETVTIEGYIEEVKRWLDLWELLDIQSQKFLPIAEFIFDELSKIPEADYAPFIVQYCRTLENEILKKLFESYHLKGLEGVNRDDLVKNDLDNPKTGKFASMVKKNKHTYTLGDMNFIMSLLKQGGNSLQESHLLQHFREFTISYFDKRIIEADFLQDIDKLTSDFRNKASHPYSIGIDMANQCQKLLRKSLNVFLESMRK